MFDRMFILFFMNVHRLLRQSRSDFENCFFSFKKVHYNCGDPVVTKSGYDEGTVWISR